MARKSVQVGHYAFLAGIVIAVIAGIFEKLLDPQLVPLLLLILGLLVGFLNVGAKEITEFLVAGIALTLVSAVSNIIDTIPGIGLSVGKILVNIGIFVTFAVLVVALKAIWELAER